jgi:hypothetical protein
LNSRFLRSAGQNRMASQHSWHRRWRSQSCLWSTIMPIAWELARQISHKATTRGGWVCSYQRGKKHVTTEHRNPQPPAILKRGGNKVNVQEAGGDNMRRQRSFRRCFIQTTSTTWSPQTLVVRNLSRLSSSKALTPSVK